MISNNMAFEDITKMHATGELAKLSQIDTLQLNSQLKKIDVSTNQDIQLKKAILKFIEIRISILKDPPKLEELSPYINEVASRNNIVPQFTGSKSARHLHAQLQFTMNITLNEIASTERKIKSLTGRNVRPDRQHDLQERIDLLNEKKDQLLDDISILTKLM